MHEPSEAQLLDNLQTEVAKLLTAIGNLAPLLQDLRDTYQPGLGFLTPEGKEAQGAAHLADKRDLALRAAAGYTTVTGSSPSPGNLAAVSAGGILTRTLHRLVRHLVADLARYGVCTLVRVPADATTDELLAAIRNLVNQTPNMVLLARLQADLATLRDELTTTIDGNDRTVLKAPCPWCGLHSLVVYFGEHLIRCDRDPETGRHEPCVCNDHLCECRIRPAEFRHEWHRAKGNKVNGWLTLDRLINPDRRPGERMKLLADFNAGLLDQGGVL